ncbi:response regulator transcription factor [Nocardia sp. NPDC127579]|uniref:response regulator transcription factor n=1 Tax=Nocardia sp. NPDC127579 TaxID=3345402 RepID=UPI003635B57D
MRLAIVEEDDEVGDALVDALTDQGFRAERVRGVANLLATHRDYDVVLLDIGLPDHDGLDTLRRLREVSSIPVVLLTARDDERTVVRGLRGGADDFIVKPPRITELIARIEAVTRRAAASPGPVTSVIVTDGVQVNLTTREVEVSGERITLTDNEFELVEALVRRRGSAVSREVMLDRVRSLDTHLATLRRKLGRPGPITTIRGYGYRWGN